MEMIRRSYKETWFWLLIAGIVYTLLTETLGISNVEVREYADGVVKKVATNISGIYIFVGSIVLMVKTTIENVQKRSINKDIILARLTERIKPIMEETVMEDIESIEDEETAKTVETVEDVKEDVKVQEGGDKVTRNIILTNDELKEFFDIFNEYIKKQISENRRLEKESDEKSKEN